MFVILTNRLVLAGPARTRIGTRYAIPPLWCIRHRNRTSNAQTCHPRLCMYMYTELTAYPVDGYYIYARVAHEIMNTCTVPGIAYQHRSERDLVLCCFVLKITEKRQSVVTCSDLQDIPYQFLVRTSGTSYQNQYCCFAISLSQENTHGRRCGKPPLRVHNSTPRSV